MLRIEELQSNVRRLTEMVIDGDYPGLIIVGSGGVGKSHSVLEAIRSRGLAAQVFNSHVTPQDLYQLLFEHRGDPIIVFEDMEHIYREDKIVSLLRSALWGPEDEKGRMKRILSWPGAENFRTRRELPPSFEYEGGMVMIGNTLPRRNDFFAALLTRTPTIRFEVESHHVFEFMRKLVAKGQTLYDSRAAEAKKLSRKDCLTVVDYLEDRGVGDLRTFKHALRLYHRYRVRGRWKALVDEIIAAPERPLTDPARVVRELERRGDLSGEERERVFKDRTGRSRATYYRAKKRLLEGP